MCYCNLYLQGAAGRLARCDYASTCVPLERDPVVMAEEANELRHQLFTSGMLTPERAQDLDDICKPLQNKFIGADYGILSYYCSCMLLLLLLYLSASGQGLYQTCQVINNKFFATDPFDEELGTEQEIAIAQFMRMLGRGFRYNDLVLKHQNQILGQAEVWVARTLVDIFLDEDDSTVSRDLMLAKLRSHKTNTKKKDFDYLIVYLETGAFVPPVCSFDSLMMLVNFHLLL